MSCEECGRMWCDEVAGGEVTLREMLVKGMSLMSARPGLVTLEAATRNCRGSMCERFRAGMSKPVDNLTATALRCRCRHRMFISSI
jgi:hypothetical protein